MLGGEAEWSAARDEDVEVRRAVEERGHVRGGGGEVFEVVEQQERARSRQCLGDAVDEGTRTLADADDVRDRDRDELGVGDRCQPDQVHRALERRERGDLEREPALAGSSRAGQRHEPHVRAAEQRERPAQVLAPPDEAVVERWERRSPERAQRGEGLLQAGGDELEELLRAGDVLQPVAAERPERDPALDVVAHEVARRPRDDDLAAVRGRADPRRNDDVHADVALLAQVRLAGVDADAQAHDAVRRPRLGLEGTL